MIRDVFFMLLSIAIVVLSVIVSVFVFLCVTSCSLSFTNIDTHGSANDLVDEEQTTSPDIKTDVKLPVIP